jgi:hypothetical protein
LSELVLQERDAILRFGDLAPHAVFRLALRLFEAGVSLSLQQGEGGLGLRPQPIEEFGGLALKLVIIIRC